MKENKTTMDKLAAAGFVNIDATTAGNVELLSTAWAEKRQADSTWKESIARLVATDCPEYTCDGDTLGGAAWVPRDIVFAIAAMEGWSYANYASQRAAKKVNDLVRNGDRVATAVRRATSAKKPPAVPLNEQNLAQLKETIAAAQKAVRVAQDKLEKARDAKEELLVRKIK